MSGGEQQIVAIARGLMSRPRLLMIDEPLLGLSPSAVDRILDTVQRVNASGVAVLFTEQNVQLALSVSHRGYVLESGRIAVHGRSDELLGHELVRRVYLGL
jgi:branched-chain amino acid transport system ATP-binding protein